VSGYLNELALLVLTAHAVTVALSRYGRPVLLRWLRAAVIGAVLVIPVVVVSARETGAVTWISRPDPASLGLLFHDYFGATAAAAAALIICVIAALLPALPGEPAPAAPGEPARAARAWWRSGGISVQSVAAPLLIVPAVLLIAESLVARPFYVDRYVLYGEAGAALLAAAGAYRIGQWLTHLASARPASSGPVASGSVASGSVASGSVASGSAGSRPASPARVLVAAPAAILVACCLVFQLSAQRLDRTPASREFDFGGPSRFIAAHARPGDGVLYLGAFYRKAALGYPADYTRLTDFGLAVSPAASGTFQGIDKNFQQLTPLMLHYQRIWTVGRPPQASFPPGLIRGESRELIANYTRTRHATFRGVIVTLWIRN